MDRYLKFALVASVIFAVPYVYLAHSLAGTRTEGWLLVAVPFLCVLALPLSMLAGDRSVTIWWRDLLSHLAFIAMGITTYLFVFTCLRDLIWATGYFEAPNTFVFAGAFFAMAIGCLIAATGPRGKKVTVRLKDLPPALDGFRIAQISDLHAGPTIRAPYVRRVVRRANAFAPGLVALTGDIADAALARTMDAVAPLAELTPAGRAYYVTGNHEYYWGAPAWTAHFQTLGLKPLLNAGERISVGGAEAFVAGIVDPTAAEFGGPKPDLVKAISGAGQAPLKILLSHRPGYAHEAAQLGFDLQLSGHTHGGQFFPWTLVVAFVHEFHSGLKRAGRLWIYVSVGTGTWGPLLRLGTWPEVTLITLRAE